MLLSFQLRPCVSATDLNSISCTFMCQQDLGMRNMNPNEYLNATAKVHGTSKERYLESILLTVHCWVICESKNCGSQFSDESGNMCFDQLKVRVRSVLRSKEFLLNHSSLNENYLCKQSLCSIIICLGLAVMLC